MASLFWAAITPEIALAATTAKTVLQIASPTNQRVKVLRWGVYFDGISPSAEPVVVTLRRQTTAIGGSPTSVTLVKTWGLGSETIQSSSTYSAGGSEPTGSDILDTAEVHPQSSYEVLFLQNQEILLPGGTRLGIVCTAPAVVNVIAKIWAEE